MSRIVKVSNGDYRIQVQAVSPSDTTPTIFLDTGALQGRVVITGNLDVKGSTTTVESQNTTIKDSIITLNKGETSAGVNSLLSPAYQSGIEVDRGTLNNNARWVWDDHNVNWYDNKSAATSNGAWVAYNVTDGTSSAVAEGIKVSKIQPSNGGDLQVDLGGGDGVLRVTHYDVSAGASYASRIQNTDYDTIPNVQYLQLYVASTYSPGSGQGQAIVHSIQDTTSGTTSLINATTNLLTFTVGGTSSTMTSSGLYLGGQLLTYNVQVAGNTTPNTITTIGSGNPKHVVSTNDNLILTSNNTTVEVNGVIQLDNHSVPASSVSGASLIYSGDPGTGVGTPGKTGLYFKNTLTTDELISKNRAVLLSILL